MDLYFSTSWGGCFNILFEHSSKQDGKEISLGRLRLMYRRPCAIFPNGATGVQLLGDRERMRGNAF